MLLVISSPPVLVNGSGSNQYLVVITREVSDKVEREGRFGEKHSQVIY